MTVHGDASDGGGRTPVTMSATARSVVRAFYRKDAMSPDPARSTPSTSTRVEELVAECLDRIDQDGEAAMEEFCREHPADAGAIRRRIEILRSVGVLVERATAESEPFPDRLGEFRLLEKLGGGGMGVVYRARQESLEREVALKVIRPDFLYFGRARERFVREMSSVARLQHAGIVPIYSVGEQDGIPYFAMELVRGCTLAQALHRNEGRRPEGLTGGDLVAAARTFEDAADGDGEESPGIVFDGTWADAATRIVLRVAEALQHVHDRGILHRDIKPSNVMITGTGRVMLLDFGLASSDDDARLTRTGAPLGSIHYMSPEQLAGEDVDARTDVFSLGATLYELLTNSLPYPVESLGSGLLSAPRYDPPRSVRRQNPSVSWELETVCRTAIEPDRARRYASMRDFALDLTHVLEHRPILAKRPGPWRRARRWIQRHPTATVAITLSLLLLSAATIVYARQQNDARTRIDRQRQAAVANLVKAKEAVDRMLTRVASETLLATPYMEEVRRDLFLDALEFYQRFLADSTGDLDLRKDASSAWLQVGEIQRQLGNLDEAVTAFETSIATFEEQDPSDPAVAGGLASALNELANLYTRDVDRADEARLLHERSLAVKHGVVARDPSARGPRRDLANGYANLAAWMTRNGAVDEADVSMRRAVALLDDLAAEGDTSLEWSERAGAVHTNMAAALLHRERTPEAIDHLTAAIEAYQTLLARRDRPEDRFNLACTLINLSVATRSGGRQAESAAHAERAVEVLTALATDFPRVPDYRDRLARAHRDAGTRAAEAGDVEPAREHFDLALAQCDWLCREYPDKQSYAWTRVLILRSKSHMLLLRGRIDDGFETLGATEEAITRLAEEYPHIVDYAHTRVQVLNDKAVFLSRAGRAADAQAALRSGIAAAEGLLGRFPDQTSGRVALARLHNNLAFELTRDAPQDARAQVARGLEIANALFAADPENADFRVLVAELSTTAADLERDAGDLDAAHAYFRRGYDLRAALFAREADPAAAGELSGAELNLARVAQDRGDAVAAVALFEDGVAHARQALERLPDHPFFRDYLKYGARGWAGALLDLGRHQEAADVASDLARDFEGDERVHREAAALLARCAALAEDDASRLEAERAALAESYRARAVLQLQAAVDAGYRDLQDLRTSPDLDPLRSTAAFLELQAVLAIDQ